MPYHNENLAFAVDQRTPETLVVRPGSPQDAFEPVGVRGGRGLQTIEAEFALAEVEGIERSDTVFETSVYSGSVPGCGEKPIASRGTKIPLSTTEGAEA